MKQIKLNKSIQIVLLFCALLCSVTAYAQTKQVRVTGKIVDADGSSLPMASITLKDTNIGVTSDLQGNYEITYPDNMNKPVLVYSYIGSATKEEEINNRTIINVSLGEAVNALSEVIVVGYGTSKIKDLTAPIAIVKADELTKTVAASAMSAIQGKVAGVQIVNSGAPGSAPKVRIRGEGGFDNEKIGPLYVVDGMFYDDINFLNTNDIETLSVLKDASAAAIYGVRSANGVVLITTKKGSRNRPTTITFDGYIGVQSAVNKLQMANTREYTQIMRERNDLGAINTSIRLWGEEEPGIPKTNTNWYDEVLRTAKVSNYSLNIAGGNEKISYALSGSYFDQDGIMNVENYYKRITAKSQADYQAFDWLKLGVNVMIISSTKTDPNNGTWSNAYNTPSIMPIEDLSFSDQVAYPRKFVTSKQAGFTGFFENPYLEMYYKSNQKGKSFQAMPSFFAEFTFIPNKLVFKTSYNQSVNMDQQIYMKPAYRSNSFGYDSKLKKRMDIYSNYILDNVLTYTDKIGKHNYSAMLGQSARSDDWRQISGEANNVLDGKDEYYYLSNGDGVGRDVQDDGTSYRGLSVFGRVTYDYDGRYLLSATLRRDGSSKYQEKYSNFPSLGVAWVINREQFMANVDWINFLKVRASWGVLGNDKVPASDGFKKNINGLGYSGVFGNGVIPGFVTEKNFTYLSWEEVDEVDFGFDLTMLNSRLNFEFDYYRRLTKNATMMQLNYSDSKEQLVNGGKIENKGFEFSLSWNDKIGNFRYGLSTNITSLKNQVKELGGALYTYQGTAEFLRINKLGNPLQSYFGLKTNGIYQNQAEILADPIAIENQLAPGDFRYIDQNGDGKIDDSDRTIIGSHLPDLIYGLNINLGYKNFDFSMMIQGQTGAELINRKRGIYRWASESNLDKDLFDGRWTKEGDNKYPSALGLVKPWNISKFNDFYIEDASFFRIQNVQLAYTFDKNQLKKLKLQNIRISLTADRPLTVFKSNGFSPEVANGWDDQVYPLAATYSFGLRLTF